MDHNDLRPLPHLCKESTRARHLWWVEPAVRCAAHACTATALTSVCGATGATLASFLAALVHFSTEVLIFKTMSLKSAANPLIIASGGRSPSHVIERMQLRAPHACCLIHFLHMSSCQRLGQNPWLCRFVGIMDGGWMELLLVLYQHRI